MLHGALLVLWGLPAVKAPLTSFSDTKDFTEDEGELDAASGKGTFVFVFPAAVFQHKLGKRLNKERPGNTGASSGVAPLDVAASPAEKSSSPDCRHQDSVWQSNTWCPKREDQEAFAPNPAQGCCCSGSKRSLRCQTCTNTQCTSDTQTLTENPNFLNSLAQRDRRLSLLRLLSLSDSNASWRKQ